MKRPRLEVNLEELDQIIDRGTQAPLSESESEKLKSALHALAGMLPKPRTTKRPRMNWSGQKRPRPKMIRSLLPVTGATEPLLTPVRRESPFRIRSYTPATPAQAVKKAKSIRRKNRGRW